MPQKKNKTGFWEEGYFAETLSSAEVKEKMKTFHQGHDDEMKFACSKCGAKISAHNKDWHGGMCNDCSFEAITGKRQKPK